MDHRGAVLLGDSPLEPNHGLLLMAAELRDRGVRVHILDFHILDLFKRKNENELLSDSDIAKILSRFKYTILGISVIAVSESYADVISRISREHLPNAKILVGGLHASSQGESLKRVAPAVDRVVAGHGTPAIVEELQRSGKRVGEPSQKKIKKAYDLVAKEVELMPRVVTTHECPHRCLYCSPARNGLDASLFGSQQSPDDIAQGAFEEIEELNEKYGVDFLVIGNLSFLPAPKGAAAGTNAGGNRGRQAMIDRALLEKLIRSPRKITYWCQMRVDDIDAERAALLAASGCQQVAIGIEAADEADVLHRHGKKYADARSGGICGALEALVLLKNVGISTYGYFIIGVPGQGERELMSTLQFLTFLLKYQVLDSTHLSVPVPYPGTPWHDESEKLGISLQHKQYSKYWMNCDPLGYGPPVINTPLLSADKIYQYWFDALDLTSDAFESEQPIKGARRLFNLFSHR
jgi:radical SAM superfamily enzyme YgiQ (UPF0313 family)